MKKFRTLTAGILASAMVMSMTAGFSAFAVDGDEPASVTEYAITIENISGDTAKHKYDAYQIFAGTNNGADLDITGWGTGVDTGKLKNALKDIADFADVKINDTVDSAKAVAEVLRKYKDNDANMQAFAKAVGSALAATATKTTTSNVIDIAVKDEGYYLIKDTADSPDKAHSAKTRYILTRAEELTKTAKSDFPTIEKNIIEGDYTTKANTAAIGDTVVYQLDSKVPDMTGYDKYYFIVNDSIFEGLTLDKKADSFNISIGDKTLTPGTDFYFKDVKDSQEHYDDFEIVFVNFIQYKGDKGKDIVIKYEAELNENAKVGTEGNPNYVDLTFSNDPNYDYFGSYTPDDPTNPTKPEEPDFPDEPNPGDPTNPDNPGNPKEPVGVTPKDKVITYTTAIELTKVDAADITKTLTGAEFKITGEGVESTVRGVTSYVEDEEGTFYMLKGGTYTETAPASDGSNAASYESTTKKYKETVTFEHNKTGKSYSKVDMKVNDSGVLKLNGLNPGKYIIEETKEATGGYVLSSEKAEITITAEPSIDSCKWEYVSDGHVTSPDKAKDGTFTFKFTNPKGVALPGTGAFGTKLIYALGTLFTGTGAAYMVSKKKSKKDE